MRKLLAATAVVALMILATATPAAAHAELVDAQPAAGDRLDRAPGQVTLTFTEPVDITPSSVRVFASDGDRVDAAAAKAGDSPASVVLELPRLADGTYAVAWRVVSEDAHPIHGAYSFGVGVDDGGAGAAGDLARELSAADGGNPTVDVLYGIARFLTFAAVALTIGGFVTAAFVWTDALDDRRTIRVIRAAIVTGVLSTTASIGLQGAYAAGFGIASVARPSLVSSVIATRFGWSALTRILLFGVALLLTMSRLRPRSAPKPAAVLLAVGLAVTLALAGHAASGDAVGVAIAADIVHLVAVGSWLGGLVLIAAVCLRGHGADDVRAAVVRRFSRLALGAVLLIIITGSIQSLRQVGLSFPALTSTAYGRLLLTKVGVFALLVGVAWISRSLSRRGAEGLSQLRRTVGAEVALAVAVLAVTSALVNAVPAKTALAQPASVTIHTEELLIDVTVDPAKRGPTEIHVYTLTHAGEPVEVQDASATLTLESPPVGPIDVPLHKTGLGHYSAVGVDLPLPGSWQFEVVAVLNDISQSTGSATIEVR